MFKHWLGSVHAKNQTRNSLVVHLFIVTFQKNFDSSKLLVSKKVEVIKICNDVITLGIAYFHLISKTIPKRRAGKN